MQNTDNQILTQDFVDDMSRQVYNTMKILYAFKEEDRERIIKQLVNDFLKKHIKTEDHAITKESSGN